MSNLIRLIRQALLLGVLSMFSSSYLLAAHLSSQFLVSAKLDGSQEVPQVTTSADGVASFFINETWDSLFVNISVRDLSGPITGIHVHEGAIGANGPVVTSLTPFVEGNRVIATLTGGDLTPTMLSKYLTGEYYLNVHTAANPNGEIRGQLTLEQDWPFRADLDTNQENHTVLNEAFGTAFFNVSQDGGQLNYLVVADQLSGAITGAHLHIGAKGVDGPVALNLTANVNGNVIKGSAPTSSAPGIVANMLLGNVYVNIHTTANPNGEIRGQLWLDRNIAFDAELNTAQEIPAPTGANGNGVAYYSLNSTFDTLTYSVQTEGLTGAITGAHIHDGAVGSTGAVLVNLSSGINGSRIEGQITGTSLSGSTIAKMLQGETYINVHTTMNPAGEIRGQNYKTAREGLAFSLEGEQEVPKLFSLAKGSGLVSYDRDQTNAHYMMVVSDLSGPITGAHFHKGIEGQNGGVVHGISSAFSGTGTTDAAFGYWDASSTPVFTSVHALMLRTDSIYVNLHTANRPGGEVRGQVLYGANEFSHRTYEFGSRPVDPEFSSNIIFSARLSGDQEVPAVSTDANGVAAFTLNETRDTLWLNMTVEGLSDTITGVHIHEAERGSNGGVVTNLGPWKQKNRIMGYLTNFDLNKFIQEEYYLNVHTDANPNGEIRGQIGLESPWTFMDKLEGQQEVPAVMTNATGMIVANLSSDEKNLSLKVVCSGLSGEITGAHLHKGAVGVNGAVVEPLTMSIQDNYIVADVDPASYLNDLKNGEIYINIHTADNPAGEIRGQLELSNAMMFDSWLNGAQEEPETMVPGAGVASVWYNSTWDTLHYAILVDQISGPITGAHFHEASIGSNGPVVLNLTSNINGNWIEGIVTGNDLSDSFQDKLILGDLYLNIHTASFAAGEIRGQVLRTAHDGFGFDICGEQEVPALEVSGYGSGLVTINREHTKGHMMFSASDLTGSITGAHLHNAVKGSNGSVVYDFSNDVVNSSGFAYFTADSTGASLLGGEMLYLNIHTMDNPNGEIRGQADNAEDCPALKMDTMTTSVGDLGDVNQHPNVYPNPVSSNLKVDLNGVQAQKVELVNALGLVVASSGAEGDSAEFDVNGLPSGIYLVKTTAVNHTFVQRVLVQ